MLITDAYLELNRHLHKHGVYGVYGSRWAAKVMSMRERLDCETALDYGCGKGTLRVSLGSPEWMREYDPAIEGKETAVKSDLIVCTDVLEHIEPGCLESVLKHIARKTGRYAFLNIATRPAQKTLADGRNAHLIVEQAPWWEERIAPYFHIKEFDVRDGEISLLVSPQKEIGEIKSKSAVTKEIRGEQMRVNLPKVKKRLVPLLKGHDRTAILVCYGPSLHDTWENLGEGDVCTVSGAHDFLIERGIVPKFHMDCDPREHKGIYTSKPHGDVQYYMASCMHPKTIENLLSHDLTLWHVLTDDLTIEVLRDIEPDSHSIAGGGSIGLRALCVLFALGYRTFIVHGMDCSFAPDGGQHAAKHFGKPMSESAVRCGERWFKSSLTMVSYARHFFPQMNIMNEHAKQLGDAPFPDGQYVRYGLAGDGLLQEMVRQQGKLAA